MPTAIVTDQLINKDHDPDDFITVRFTSYDSKSPRHFEGQITFGSAQYEWHNHASGGHASPDGPAARSTIEGSAGTIYDLPKASIVVLRGHLSL